MSENIIPTRLKHVKPLNTGHTTFRSVHDWELTEKELELAARELGETEEKKQKCLRKLKEKLSRESDVKYRQDDFYLLRYLRVRKYDVSKAFKNMKLFYGIRNKHRGCFTLPQEMKPIQELSCVTCLPYLDEQDRVIINLTLSNWNPDQYSLEEAAPGALNVLDLVSMIPMCQISGVIGIYDLGGLSFRQISELLWNGRLFSIVSLLQNGYPWRIKKFIVFNTNRAVRLLFNMFKPLLQRKIVERCVLLGSDPDELHPYINPALLPKRLNGAVENEECDMAQYVLNNMAYIRYERYFISP